VTDAASQGTAAAKIICVISLTLLAFAMISGSSTFCKSLSHICTDIHGHESSLCCNPRTIARQHGQGQSTLQMATCSTASPFPCLGTMQSVFCHRRQAEFEPPFLAPRLRLHKWGAVIDAVDKLVTRIASLESALEGAYGEGRSHSK